MGRSHTESALPPCAGCSHHPHKEQSKKTKERRTSAPKDCPGEFYRRLMSPTPDSVDPARCPLSARSNARFHGAVWNCRDFRLGVTPCIPFRHIRLSSRPSHSFHPIGNREISLCNRGKDHIIASPGVLLRVFPGNSHKVLAPRPRCVWRRIVRPSVPPVKSSAMLYPG